MNRTHGRTRRVGQRVPLALGAMVLAAIAGHAAGQAAGQDAGQERSGQETVTRTTIGESRRGAAIEVIRLASPVTDEFGRGPDERPAVLVVAGLDGRHTVGPAIAQGMVDRLRESLGDSLDRVTVYIVPTLNPDGARREGGRTRVEVDADRDGRVGEDPAEDLNGDGMITMMRVKRPASSTGLSATLATDPDDARLMREPKPEEGESAEWAVLIEGIDNDGDGKFNEDGVGGSAGGGVVLNDNFPSFWPEHRDGAGAYPLSEPEARAVADWLIAHPSVQAVYVLGTGDNLVNIPEAGKFGPEGEMPTGLERDDVAWHKAVAKWFTDATGQKSAPQASHEGSLHTWAYAEMGLWSFTNPGWVRPEPAKQADEKPADGGAGDAANEGADDEPEAAADAPDPAQSLRDQGVPEDLIAFLTAGPGERAAIMAQFETMTPDQQQARMAQVMALPPAIQQRVMAIAQGQPDPGAPAGAAGSGSDDAPKKKGGSTSDDGKWLAYSDEERGGEGFVEWTTFDHPQLGEVEIGGFVPGFRMNPTDDARTELMDQHAEFVAELAGHLADVRIVDQTAVRVGPGVWRVSVSLENTGFLPTTTAIARKARRLPPELLVLEAPRETIVAGDRVQRFEVVGGSGARQTAEWTLMARDGTGVEVTLRSARFGDRVVTVRLREGG